MAGSANNDKKVFDVAKPGKTPPASTARPVIVGHRSMVQDPMVATPSNEAPKPDTAPSPLAGRGKTLIPVSEHTDEVQPDTKPEPKPKEEPKGEELPAEKTPAEEPTPPADKTPEPEQSTPEPPKADPPAEQSEPAPPASPVEDVAQQDQEGDSEALKKKEQEEKDRVEAERLDKLVATKKYSLPIREAGGRSVVRTALLGLAVLVVAALGLYLAADAKLLGDIAVPVDLIKTEPTAPATPATTTPPSAGPNAGRKTHVLNQYNVSFQYTSTWKPASDTNDQTKAGLLPTGELADNESVFLLSFASYPAFNSTVPYSIAKVAYTDIAVRAGRTVYLRELIINNSSSNDPKYRVLMNLTDQKLTEKPGDITTLLTPVFTAPDGKSPMLFYAFITAGDVERQWFSTLEKAEAYTKTPRYLAARNVLLSTRFTK